MGAALFGFAPERRFSVAGTRERSYSETGQKRRSGKCEFGIPSGLSATLPLLLLIVDVGSPYELARGSAGGSRSSPDNHHCR